MGNSSSTIAPLKAMETPIILEKFIGKWYVIANIPTPFEVGAYNAVEEYTLTSGKCHDIDVKFNFNKNSFDGKRKEMKQKGWLYNKSTNAEWRVSPVLAGFALPLRLPYIIVDVTEGHELYESTIIGYPDRSYLWIMARKPTVADEEYEESLKKVESMGYERAKIQKVPQQSEEERK